MENEILSKLSDKEKIAIFDVALDQAKENSTTFSSQIGSVINAFMIKKKDEETMNMAPKGDFANPFEMDMTPKSEFVSEPFEMNMAPKPEFVSKPFEMNMKPKTETSSSDNYGGPFLEPIDTQKIDINNNINM